MRPLKPIYRAMTRSTPLSQPSHLQAKQAHLRSITKDRSPQMITQTAEHPRDPMPTFSQLKMTMHTVQMEDLVPSSIKERKQLLKSLQHLHQHLPAQLLRRLKEWTCPAMSPDSLDMQIMNYCQDPEESLTVWICHAKSEMYSIQCSPDTTVGQVAVAESKITDHPITCTDIKTMTAVGSELPAYSYVYDRQIIVIRHISEGDTRCPMSRCNTQPPALTNMTRAVALWNQLGWVAFDEMTFYLTSVQAASQASTTEPLHFHDNMDDAVTFGKWVIQVVGKAAAAGNDLRVGIVCLFKNHWFPLIAHVQEDRTSFTTTIEAVSLLNHLIQTSFPSDGTNPTVGPVILQCSRMCFQQIAVSNPWPLCFRVYAMDHRTFPCHHQKPLSGESFLPSTCAICTWISQ